MQRAIDATVSVQNQTVGGFTGPGLVVLVGVTHTDTPAIAQRIAEKIHGLRIIDHNFIRRFDSVCVPPNSPRELSAGELDLPVLMVSQFTLYASTAKGRRPTWDAAAAGPVAQPLVSAVVERLRGLGTEVATGIFGADMDVNFTNSGPMTVILDIN